MPQMCDFLNPTFCSSAFAVGPEKGYKDDWRAGAHLLLRKFEGTDMFSLAKRNLMEDLIVAFQYLKGAY